MTTPSWIGTGLTDRGRIRTSNQDAFSLDNALGIWIVADGMGGHTGGHVASAVAVTTVLQSLGEFLHQWNNQGTFSEFADGAFAQAIEAGRNEIQLRVTEDPALTGMGTTIVAAWLDLNPIPSMAIAHVGDSRAYLVRDNRLIPLTKDHSLVQQLIAEGHITVEDSLTHPKRNVLVKALGPGYPSTPEVTHHPLQSDDVILLCTDGLTKLISEADILSIIVESHRSPEECCQRLIGQANAAGGTDNTTVLLITPIPPYNGSGSPTIEPTS
jgi:protein phosphatase